MILRVAFFALMALGLTGFGTVAWLSTRSPAADAHAVQQAAPPAPPPAKKVMLVTARPLHVGNLLKPEDVIAREIPANDVTDDMLGDSPDMRGHIVGALVRRAMGPNETLRAQNIIRPGDHGFLAAVLGPGMRAITIGVDATSGSAGLIWPGDRVDVILTQTIGDGTVPIGRRIAAETVSHDTRVIAIDQQLVQGAAPAATDNQGRTVTLEVPPDQAERLSVAIRLGRLSLSLRAAADQQQVGEARGNRPTWARDVSPALNNDSAPTTDSVVRIFQGATSTKEFKF